MLVNGVEEQCYSLLFYLKKSYRLIIFILLSITIGSCYSIESDCGEEGSFWKLIPGSPTNVYRMACDANGNLWTVTYGNGDVYLYNGTSWQQRGSVGGVANAIAVAPNGDIYIVGDLSLYRSTNGGTIWNTIFNVNKKIEKDELAEIVISHSGEVYFATPNNIYVSDGSSWRRANTNGVFGDLCYPIALAQNGTLYATERTSSNEQYIIHSTDAGNSWLRSTGFYASMVYGLTVVDNNTIFAAAGHNGILKSTDGGRNWYPTIEGVTDTEGVTAWVWGIIYNSKTGTLFADIDGYALFTCNAVISTDLGESWEVQNDGLGTKPGLGPYCFAFNPITDDTYLRVVRNYPAPIWEGWVGGVYRHTHRK
jgi:sugar lactone lactonase YvrE